MNVRPRSLPAGAFTLARPGHARRRERAAWGTAALVVLIGLSLTWGLFAQWRQRSWDVLARDFNAAAVEQAERVISTFHDDLEDLDAVRRFFEGVPTVSRQQFHDFVIPILERHSLQALEWLPRVPLDQRPEHEAAARRDGLSGFQFTEPDGEGRPVPAADRAEYFPVYYLEPYAGNAQALGFAPGPSHPARGAALAAARDNGQLAATGRYILVQEPNPGQRFSILVFAPVYANSPGKPAVEAERRRQLRGFVLGVMRVEDVVARALRAEQLPELVFRLLDLSADHEWRWLYDHPTGTGFPAGATLGFHRDFSLADRTWRIEVAPTPAFLTRHHDTGYYWIPVVGGLLTLLAALYLFTLVSQRGRAEALVAARTAELRQSEDKFRRVVDHAPFGFHLYRLADDDRLVLEEANPAADTLLKRRHADRLGGTLEDIFPALVQTDIPAAYRRLARQGGACRWEAVPYQDDGIAGSFNVVAFQTAPAALAVAFTDITERRRAEERQRLAAAVFEAARDAILVTDPEGRIVAVNPAYTTLTGYTEAEVLGRTPRHLWAERQPDSYFETMWQTVTHEGAWQGEFRARRKDGDRRAALASLGAVRDTAGQITHCVGIATDITALKAAEQRIEHLAFFDALTDLPNRTLLAQRATLSLALAARRGEELAVLFLDLDRFKEVNDALGHAEGDALLVQVAQRLRAQVRAEDTACRLGGDEFVLLLPGAGQEGALRVADKLLAGFRHPFAVAGHALGITVSIGIALYPHDGADFTELLKNADTALYRAKQDGRNTRVFYDRQMNVATFERLLLEAELRKALAAGHLCAYFQPKVCLADGALAGAEALVRWFHPEHGLIPPDRFIPVAEVSDLVVALGDWMLVEVCRQLAAWRRLGLPPLTVAINLAARHFRLPSLADRICGLLEAYGLPPQVLELELTESTLLESGTQTEETLRALERLGVGLAIDDFGTGYSSLSYLKRLPLTALKIDRSFVRDLVTDPDDRILAATIVALGHQMKLVVVAEGVETEDQRRILMDQGCDLAQGYLFSHPLPAEAFAEWRARYRAGDA